MKTKIWFGTRRVLGGIAVAMLLLCTGCLEKRIVWSPDGSRAAVISDDGLFLCDAEGHLSELLLPNIYRAAWFGGSRRLALARSRTVKDWKTIAATLGADAAKVETEADALWRDLDAGKPWGVITMDLKHHKDALKICVRERYAERLQTKLNAGDWSELDKNSVELNELVLAHVDGAKVVVDSVRHIGYGSITDVRVAPHSDAIAFSQEIHLNSDDMDVLVVSLRDDAPAAVVGQHTAGFPDWSSDGRSIVYVEASGDGAKDALTLGVLARREVINSEGRVALADSPQYLAGMMFNQLTHVRCLHDGRVLFNATEMSLPMAAEDYGGDQREQLFAVDLARQATLVRLIPRKRETDVPQMLGFFEVSPDEKQVLIGGGGGEVSVLTLATGEVSTVQDESKVRYHGLPVWRRAGEFSYVKRIEGKDGKEPARPAEVILRNGDKETVLSQSWPTETLARIAKNHSK